MQPMRRDAIEDAREAPAPPPPEAPRPGRPGATRRRVSLLPTLAREAGRPGDAAAVSAASLAMPSLVLPDRPALTGHDGRRILAVRWLLVATLGLLGFGQWCLIHGHDPVGAACYFFGISAALAGLVAVRGDIFAPGGRPAPLSGRAVWFALAAIGQVVAFQLARPHHGWWSVFLPWALSLLAAVAIVAPLPAVPVPRWLTAARLHRAALVAVFGLAALLRLAALETLPLAIHGDEGEFGLIALAVSEGRGPSPFGVAFLDDPAFYPHLLAPFITALGASMTAIRLPSALFGIAGVALFYAFVRDLGGRRAGLIAAVLLASSAAHIHFSRVALNVVEAPFWVCLSMWLLWKGLATQRALWYLLAGIAGGLGCYFHFSARIVVPILALALAWQWAARHLTARQFASAAALVGVGGVLSLSPLLSHTLGVPEQLTSHPDSRMIWNHWAAAADLYRTTPDDRFGIMRGQVLGTLAWLVERPDPAFLAFTRMPMVGAVVAPAMVLGLIVLGTRPRARQAGILLPWFACSAVFGSVLVNSTGNYHRLLLVLPALLAAAALLIDRLSTVMSGMLPARVGPHLAAGLLLIAPVTAVAETRTYFDPGLSDRELGIVTVPARQIQAQPSGTLGYLLAAPLIYTDHGVLAYLGHAAERRDLYNPTAILPAQSGDQALNVLVHPMYAAWLPLLRAYYPQAHVEAIPWADGARMLYKLSVPAGAVPATPPAGLRGQIAPGGGKPVQLRHDPALAFIRLHEIAGTPEHSARWEGTLRPPGDGAYQLEIVTDGAVTLTLDGATIVASPAGTRTLTTVTQEGRLESRTHAFAIAGSWVERTGYLALYWRRGDGERELVPPSAFMPAPLAAESPVLRR